MDGLWWVTCVPRTEWSFKLNTGLVLIYCTWGSHTLHFIASLVYWFLNFSALLWSCSVSIAFVPRFQTSMVPDIFKYKSSSFKKNDHIKANRKDSSKLKEWAIFQFRLLLTWAFPWCFYEVGRGSLLSYWLGAAGFAASGTRCAHRCLHTMALGLQLRQGALSCSSLHLRHLCFSTSCELLTGHPNNRGLELNKNKCAERCEWAGAAWLFAEICYLATEVFIL